MEAESKWLEERGPELICQPTHCPLIAESLSGIWMSMTLERHAGEAIDS